MGGIYKSWNALKSAMLKEVSDLIKTTTLKSYKVLQENVNNFYNSTEGPNYQRTGQLASSPQIDGYSAIANGAIGQISINTTTQYDPAGRDTNWIYHVAENDELWGNGNFWAKTENQVRQILIEETQKRFG